MAQRDLIIIKTPEGLFTAVVLDKIDLLKVENLKKTYRFYKTEVIKIVRLVYKDIKFPVHTIPLNNIKPLPPLEIEQNEQTKN